MKKISSKFDKVEVNKMSTMGELVSNRIRNYVSIILKHKSILKCD